MDKDRVVTERQVAIITEILTGETAVGGVALPSMDIAPISAQLRSTLFLASTFRPVDQADDVQFSDTENPGNVADFSPSISLEFPAQVMDPIPRSAAPVPQGLHHEELQVIPVIAGIPLSLLSFLISPPFATAATSATHGAKHADRSRNADPSREANKHFQVLAFAPSCKNFSTQTRPKPDRTPQAKQLRKTTPC